MSTAPQRRGPRERTPLAVKVAIQMFALTVGLALFIVIDRLTGWFGVFD